MPLFTVQTVTIHNTNYSNRTVTTDYSLLNSKAHTVQYTNCCYYTILKRYLLTLLLKITPWESYILLYEDILNSYQYIYVCGLQAWIVQNHTLEVLV